jgi:transposase-like protein
MMMVPLHGLKLRGPHGLQRLIFFGCLALHRRTTTGASVQQCINRGIASGTRSTGRKGLNNRAESSHQPTHRLERARRRFKSSANTQRFLERFGPTRQYFCLTTTCSARMSVV